MGINVYKHKIRNKGLEEANLNEILKLKLH